MYTFILYTIICTQKKTKGLKMYTKKLQEELKSSKFYGKRDVHSVRHSDILFKKASDFSVNCGYKIGDVYDMALLSFFKLVNSADFSQSEHDEEKEFDV